MGYLKPGGELTQSEKGRAGRFASLKSVTLFSLRTFPLVAIIGSRKFRTREGRILHILYGRGKKERARQPLTTSFLVIEKILTNREESWVHGGRGRGFPGPAFLRLRSIPCFPSSDYSAQAAVSFRASIERHHPARKDSLLSSKKGGTVAGSHLVFHRVCSVVIAEPRLSTAPPPTASR